jgi:hypothetical protein
MMVFGHCVKARFQRANGLRRFVKEIGIYALSAEICTRMNSSTNTVRLPDKRQRYSDQYMKHIFFSVLTTLAFSFCSEPAPEPKNILSCYMRYDAAGRKTKAEASLRDGATQKTIDFPNGISYQSTPMKAYPVRGITYAAEYAANFTPEPYFEWKDKAGKPTQYTLQAPSIDSFYFAATPLSVKTANQLRWIGQPLIKGETLVFMWENLKSGETRPMEVSSSLGVSLIEFPAAKIAELGPGEWSLYMVRKRLAKAETGNYLVECISEYYTKPTIVTIRE